MKKFFKEFKDFALRGNVVDLAVGVIIGAALQSVVKSLTDNILAPIIGLFAGQNFDALSVTIPTWNGEIQLLYGAFITAVISFIITAFVVFLLVRGMNRLARIGEKHRHGKAPDKALDKAPDTKVCPFCCTDIPVQAVKCPHCTADIPADTKPVST